MEERMLDEDELRKVKLKRTADGGTDAVEDMGEDVDVEVELSSSEELFGEYDEDLVGLTPSQLQEELERRERERKAAQEQSEKLAAEGEEKLAAGEFAEAAELFHSAISFDGGNTAARKGYWTALTENFTSAETLYEREEDFEFSAEEEEVRAFVLGHMRARVEADCAAFSEEEGEIAPAVEAAQAERRAAFRANRKYYAARAGGLWAAFVVLLIGCGVAVGFLFRTPDLSPVIAAAVLGGAAFIFFAVFAVYAGKWFVANRYCRMNEDLSSTEKGARLAFLRKRGHIAARILGEETEETEESAEETPEE